MKFSKIKLEMVREKNFDYNSYKIKSPIDIVKYINEIERLEKLTEEIVILICLNTKNQIVAYSEIAKGTMNCCHLDFKSIFKTVLLCNASKIIIVHNHPSGNAQASSYDINFTKRLSDVSKLMGIELLDHLIIANSEYSSCMN